MAIFYGLIPAAGAAAFFAAFYFYASRQYDKMYKRNEDNK